MAKNAQQAALEAAKVEPIEKTAAKKPEFEDDDPVTVIWKSWGKPGMPRNKITYFDRHEFTGGVGRRIPYHVAKKWQQQGHGIYILPVLDPEKEELEFIRVTGHAPLQDAELQTMLQSVSLDKLAAMLGPENLDKIAAMHRK